MSLGVPGKRLLIFGQEYPGTSGASVHSCEIFKQFLSEERAGGTFSPSLLVSKNNSGVGGRISTYPFPGFVPKIVRPFFAGKFLKKAGCDVVHADFYNTGAAAGLAVGGKTPLVVTIHDVIPWFRNEYSKKGLIYYKFCFEIVQKKADAVLVVSKTSAKEAVEFAGIEKDRVFPVYNGINHEVFYPDANKGAVGSVFTISYCGGYGSRKNVDLLVGAAELLSSRRGSLFPGKTLRIALVGTLPKLLLEKISNLGLSHVFRPLGFVSLPSLRKLYSNSDIFVFPSLAEGFGMPPLEAMACGCPVLSSNASCLPEILGNSAEYFDPLSAEDLAEKIISLENSPARLKRLSCAGKEQAAKYSWAKTCKSLEKIYAKLL
ncbi:MAG: glycosyltransferase family 1 protein [archaeon]